MAKTGFSYVRHLAKVGSVLLVLLVLGPGALLLLVLLFLAVRRLAQHLIASAEADALDRSHHDRAAAWRYWRDSFDSDTEEYWLKYDQDVAHEFLMSRHHE